MFDPAAHLTKPTLGSAQTARDSAYRKLYLLSMVLRMVLALYAVFSLMRFVPWWFNPHNVGHLSQWQQWGGLAVNLLPWCLLVGCIVFVFRFMAQFQTHKTFTAAGGAMLMRCAWLAVACQATTMLARPATQSLMTLQNQFELNPFLWQFTPRDPIAIMLCLALLMFAYVHRWTLDIAQENASFV